MKTSFRAYIDESGDEGFVFRPDGTGSSRWFVLTAVVVHRANDLRMVALARDVRQLLGREPNQALHFYKMGHPQCVAYARRIGECHEWLRSVSVFVHKPSIADPAYFQTEKHSLYRYTSRLLMERLSWFCRDNRRANEGDGTAEVIFSNRDQMCYDTLRAYLRRLRDKGGTSVCWEHIMPDQVRAVQADQLAGLQVADAVAHSFYDALSPNRFGDIEDRYAKLVWPTLYKHADKAAGYGFKFWPLAPDALTAQHPHVGLFIE